MTDNRPSPDAILAAIQREREHQGKLKVFLGAAPGVGKTYTMLEAGRERAAAGTDVVTGIVETHGRTETAEMILGLGVMPRKKIEHGGKVREEMDLDAILALRPQLVLVDELAHTNATGSRHPKRYLDVEELLAAGIDVYTTLNIQHVESLNDAVAQITGIQVRETVPDRIMERADEVELVDLSVEDLIQRLGEGKVYIPEQAERAIRNYFRPGNLSALRQLALRHIAERVDAQMHMYMQAHAIPGPWPAGERLLVSIGPSPFSARLIRATRRMADRRRATWIAVYVETPRHYRLSDADRDRISQTLRLAEELGGEAVTIPGNDIAEDLIHFAQARNVTEIVVGKSARTWTFELLHGSVVKQLIRESGDIDVYVISGDAQPGDVVGVSVVRDKPPSLNAYAGGIATVLLAAVVASLLRMTVALPNISMVFLMAVLFSAVLWGLRVSIVVSLLSVLVFDFFFVDPVYTFAISSPQEVLALITFLVAAVLTSNLTGRVRDQAEAARQREGRTASLYELSKELSAAAELPNVVNAVVQQIAQSMKTGVVALLPENDMLLPAAAAPGGAELNESERASATWAWRNDRTAGSGADTLPGDKWFYLPLRTVRGVVGVLAIRFDTGGAPSPDQRRLLTALAGQAALAIERARLARDFEAARLTNERERLQTILLSSISHDLRTPLATILGGVTSLIDGQEKYDAATKLDLLTTIQQEAERLNRFVGNLLDTTRLESGALKLSLEWVEIGDVVGAAVAKLGDRLKDRKLEFDFPKGLPLVHIDFVLVEQVFVNLLDNAAKYSAPGTAIKIAASVHDGVFRVIVADEGIGIAADDLDIIFDKFYRVRGGDRQIAGTGLGLSICRGIIEEHGGTIRAHSPSRFGSGTEIVIAIPATDMPPQLTGE